MFYGDGGKVSSSDYAYFYFCLVEYGTDDTINFVRLYELSPMSLTKIEIVTDGYEDKTEFGDKPEIIPFGINSCSATVTGTFSRPNAIGNMKINASYPFPESNLSNNILDFDDTIRLFDEIENKSYVYALYLNYDESKRGGRDLSGGYWRIDKFTWDRNARDMGIFRFNIVLGYIWNDPSEQQMYAEGIGTKKSNTCKFIANVFGTDNGQADSSFEVWNTNISKSLYVKNTAQFDYSESILKDSFVVMEKYGGITGAEKNVFFGIVTDCENNRDGTFIIKCKECCDLLYRGVCSQGGVLGFLYPRVIIPNPDPDTGSDIPISLMVNRICQYYESKAGYGKFTPGYGIDRTGALGDSIYLPGHEEDKTKISTQIMSCISVGTALTNFLYHQCGFFVWYNYNTGGRLEYGFLRDRIDLDLAKEVVEKTDLISTNSEDIKPDGVIVFDSKGEYNGHAGEIGNDKHVIVYNMSDSKFDSALSAIAEKILELYSVDLSSYSVRFPAGTVRFKEGDYFGGLGDQTVEKHAMEYRSGDDADPLETPGNSVWQIKEITITEKGTTATVGTSYVSVLDIYKSILQRNRDGIVAPTETKNLTSKPMVVGRVK